MISMTGYGFAEDVSEDRQVSVEIRSVNNRYLDVTVNLPAFLNPLEPELRGAVSRVAVRGKIDVFVRLREFEVPVQVHVDETAAAAVVQALRKVARVADIPGQISVRDVVSMEGVIHTERRREPEQYRDPILTVLRAAMEQWNRQRSDEGAATRQDIESQLARVEGLIPAFEESGQENEWTIMESVRSRFREVLGDQADEQRIYQEAAALIVKHNTNEELVRLKSHIQLFRETAANGTGIGKKLDFVCQELNREVNTIASKALLPGVQRAVVEAKDAVEAIREQIRNVE